jgi:CHAD domain-containing protein
MDSKAAPSPDIAARATAILLRNIVANGRKAVEAPDISDADAVHELRKALKGWRAMMRLIAPAVGDEAETMRVAARDLARETAAARDGQAAEEALADLGDGLRVRSRAVIHARLIALRTSAEAVSLTHDRRTRIGQMWHDAGAAIERWPLENFHRNEAARQLAASYRRVRGSLPKDWGEADANALHKLRQRVVEHRYQMEIAEPLWPKIMRIVVSESQKLRDRLGAHHDLDVLRRLTEPDQPLARWRSHLTPLIAARQDAHAAAAKRLAGRLFAEKPKAFLRRLTALWQHCEEERDE